MRNLSAQGEVAFVPQDYQFRSHLINKGIFQAKKVTRIRNSQQASDLLSNPTNHISPFRMKFGYPALAAILSLLTMGYEIKHGPTIMSNLTKA
jgi:hypothetical protein